MFISAEAKVIVEELENRLTKYRALNDSMKLDNEKTAHLRGRIREVKDLLKFVAPEKEQTDMKVVKYEY